MCPRATWFYEPALALTNTEKLRKKGCRDLFSVYVIVPLLLHVMLNDCSFKAFAFL